MSKGKATITFEPGDEEGTLNVTAKFDPSIPEGGPVPPYAAAALALFLAMEGTDFDTYYEVKYKRAPEEEEDDDDYDYDYDDDWYGEEF